MASLITIKKGDSRYKALCQDGRLYRKEKDKIAEWKLYGGAVIGRDFDVFALESCPQSPLARDIGHQVEGIGKYACKCLKDIAQPIVIGHTLIVSPVSSPRATELDIEAGTTAYLSGVVEKIENVPDTKNITRLL